jgi:CRISPR-associated endonuclease/helicase Cas3
VTDDFEAFFMQATQYTPFPYQCRLADPSSKLPELLQVPTGTGKTAAAVLSWLWRRKKHPAETPRKLVYCLPMRVLVEQTRACAVLWLHRLERLAGLAEFDENDRVIRYEPAWGEPGKVAVATIMGGETADQWREHPESELLLVGTQDMLLSRALNRGSAAWPQDWPVNLDFSTSTASG